MDSAGVPIPRDDQIVSLSFFIGIRKARNEPHLPVLDLKVKPRSLTILETIDVVDVMLGHFLSELFVKSVYITNDPKDIRGTLVGTDLEMAQEVSKKVTHGDPTPPPLYNGHESNYHFAFPLRKYCLRTHAMTYLYTIKKVIFPPKLS